MVNRHKLLYFATLIMFMDGLYLDIDFRTWFLSFYCFYCCCSSFCCYFCWFCHFLLLLYFLINFYYVCSYSFIYLLMVASLGIIYHRLLGIPFIYARGSVWRQFYAIFNVCNFSITFFIALSSILFSYLLIFSLSSFPYNTIVVTILL